MSSRLKPKVIAGTVAGLAVAGGGAAYAATLLSGRRSRRTRRC